MARLTDQYPNVTIIWINNIKKLIGFEKTFNMTRPLSSIKNNFFAKNIATKFRAVKFATDFAMETHDGALRIIFSHRLWVQSVYGRKNRVLRKEKF